MCDSNMIAVYKAENNMVALKCCLLTTVKHQ